MMFKFNFHKFIKFLAVTTFIISAVIIGISSTSPASAQSTTATIEDAHVQEAAPPISPVVFCPQGSSTCGLDSLGEYHCGCSNPVYKQRTFAFFMWVRSTQSLSSSTFYPLYALWKNCNSTSSDYNSLKAQCGNPSTAWARQDGSTYMIEWPGEPAYPPLTAQYEQNGTYNARLCLIKQSISSGSAESVICTSKTVKVCDLNGVSGCTNITPTPTPTNSLTTNPTLSALLTGGSSGTAPYSVNYKAYATSVNNTGSYSYYFYCNRTDTGTTIGTPYETALSKTISSWLMATPCVYNTPGTYTPKVIIKQGTLLAENRKTITVSQAPTTINASLAANPSPSDTSKTVTLSATNTSNNVTDTVNYSFWWNCSSTSTSYATAVSQCGDPNNASIGAKFNNLSASTTSKSVQHIFSQAGTYKPKVIVEQGNGKATASKDLTVNVPVNPPVAKLEGTCKLKNYGSYTDREFSLSGSDWGNDATSPRDYYFWWNCRNGSSDITKTTTDCGVPTHIYDGGYSPVANNLYYGAVYKSIASNYKGTGLITRPTYIVTDFKPKLIIVKSGLSSTHEPAISCSSPVASPTPSRTPSRTPSPSPSPSKSPSPSPTPSKSPSPSPSPSKAPSPSPSPSPSVIINTLTADLTVAPAEPVAGQTVTLQAITTSNINQGTYSYYFWWNCQAPSAISTLSELKTQCGDPSSIVNGAQFLNQVSSIRTKSVDRIYINQGDYKPLVFVEHGGLTAVSNASLKVGQKPTLMANLTVNPTVAEGAAKPATLTATAGGTATGTINYTFWWHCDEEGTDITDLTAKCGDPKDSSKGAKFTDVTNLRSVYHDYISPGIFKPKVVVERGYANPQEARATITVNPLPIPTFDVSISGARINPETTLPARYDLKVETSEASTAKGKTDYRLWWDCEPKARDLLTIQKECGDPTNPSKGMVTSTGEDQKSIKVTHDYSIAGKRHPFVVAIREGIESLATTELDVVYLVNDTLTATLSVSNNSVVSNQTVKLTAKTESNNTKDSYNYYFWWDCPEVDSKVLNEVIATCGDPHQKEIGAVFPDQDKKVTTKEVSTKYLTEENEEVEPMVFVEHGSVSANDSTLLKVFLEPTLSPTPSVVASPSPSPTPSVSVSPSVIPSPTPSPSPVASPSPRVYPSKSPVIGKDIKITYYYAYQEPSGVRPTRLEEYERIHNLSYAAPTHDIYLSTDGGSSYERIEHDFDPMPGAIISRLPLNIKAIAEPWRKEADPYLKVTHYVTIPEAKLTNVSDVRLLVRVLSRRSYAGNPGDVTFPGGVDYGASFVFDQGLTYPKFAGPEADGGDVMDYSVGVSSKACPKESVTPSPVPSPVSSCAYSFTSPTQGTIYEAEKIGSIAWQSINPEASASLANLYFSKDGRNYQSIISSVNGSSVSYMFEDSDATTKGRLRLDHYDGNKLISSCISDQFTITRQGDEPISIPGNVNTALILGSLLSSVAAMILTGIASSPFLYRLANSVFALFAPPAWPGRKPSWGITYDAVSKRPLPNVVVRIFSEPDGRLRATIRSNQNGAFGFILPSGKYSAVAALAGYEFPTRLVMGSTDGKYQNVYRGGLFEVSGDGNEKAQVYVNIPLDRTHLTTFDIVHVKTLATIAKFFQVIRMPIMIIGTISAGYLLFVSHRPIDYAIGVLYLVLWAVEINNLLKKRSYGLVRDRYGSPISMALIRAVDVHGKLKSTVVTGEDGKFQLNLNPGLYRLDVSRAGYRSVKTQAFKIDKIQDIGRLDLRLEKLS